VVIAPDDIIKFAPLEMAQKGVVATQYSMGPVEDLGLLKIDFLGLSNLTTIKNTLRIVKKVYSEFVDIDQIPLDDKKTYELLQRGETTGIFQLESAGMRRYLKQLKPTVFEDIIAMVALYRPGPMQWIEDFIARKHGLREIKYLHPAVKPALENTYGVIVYQEQVMQISKEMCGFSGGQADTLRKAIGKKDPVVMAKLKSDFIEGGIKISGADRRLMERFWLQLEEFAAYCFNKVHSACYGLIAYQTAYLKAHYPIAFMAALMTSDYDNIDRLAIEITECKHMGIEVLPPDVNESFHEFGVVPGNEQIRFGLDAIKNVGFGAVEEILRAREDLGGKFESLEDFCKNVSIHNVNRKAMESLIKAGALDRFGDRGQLINNLDTLAAFAARFQKESNAGQVDLFGEGSGAEALSPKLVLASNIEIFSQSEMLSWERDLLGLYLSQHPLEAYRSFLSAQAVPIAKLKEQSEGREVTVGGAVGEVREITTKNGSKMAFVKLADETGEIEMVIFPGAYSANQSLWQRDNVVLARGKIGSGRRAEAGEIKILADEARLITPEDASVKFSGPSHSLASESSQVASEPPTRQRLYIRLQSSDDQPLLLNLKQKLDGYQGDTEVVLVTGASDNKQAIKLPQTIAVNEESLRDLASLFGATNVVVR